MGRTQVGQRTQMVPSTLLGWVDSPSSHIQQSTVLLVRLHRLTSVQVEYKFHYQMKERIPLRAQSNIIT